MGEVPGFAPACRQIVAIGRTNACRENSVGETADDAIGKVATMMGIAQESIYSSNTKNMLTIEEAGTAFALSVLSAEKYNGLEIGAIQVLNDFWLLERSSPGPGTTAVCAESTQAIERILRTFREQHRGWKERNLFEREWLMRDFRKRTGCSTEQMELSLAALHEKARDEGLMQVDGARDLPGRLKAYYENQYRLLQGWEKKPARLEENSKAIMSWVGDIDGVLEARSGDGT